MASKQYQRFFVTIQNPIHPYGSPLLPDERLLTLASLPGLVYVAQSPLEKGSTLHVHLVLMFDNSHKMTFKRLRGLLLPYAGGVS